MSAAKSMFFLINHNQDRWWLDDDPHRLPYAKVDAPPLPDEPQRERSSYVNRLAFRLRITIRPSAG